MLYQRLILSRWRQFICLRNYAKQGAVGDVIVSQRCIQRLNEIAKDGENLRVLVDGGGCSGFEYKMQLDKSINDDDIVFNAGRAKIVVDEVCYPVGISKRDRTKLHYAHQS